MTDGKYMIGLNEAKFGVVAPFWLVASFAACVGRRNADLALQTGRLYSPAAALDIGLVDELAASREDALARCRTALAELASTMPQQRFLSKMVIRGDDVRRMNERRGDDVDKLVELINLDSVQAAIGMYLASLGTKKK